MLQLARLLVAQGWARALQAIQFANLHQDPVFEPKPSTAGRFGRCLPGERLLPKIERGSLIRCNVLHTHAVECRECSQPKTTFESQKIAVLLLLAMVTLEIACGGSGRSPSAGSSASGSCNFQSGGDCTLDVNGVSRQYRLHIPSNYTSGNPLVIALHPAVSTGPGFEQASQLDLTADQVGFVIAYPTALLGSQGHTVWNGYFSGTAFSGTPPDDSGFIRALIGTLQANLNPDAKKIFVTGFSLGSTMTHRVGVEISDLVAAIAPYEDSLYAYSPPTAGPTLPNAAQPISVLMIAGSHTNLPDICGYNDNQGDVLATMDENFAYWAGTNAVLGGTSANACATLDTTATFCTGPASPANPNTQTTLAEKNATGCAAGATVEAYKLWGGTHAWYPPSIVFSNTNCSATSSPPCNPFFTSTTGTDLNDIIWNFFAAHPKP